MLNECLEYLENRAERDSTFQYEVIIVSDGSKDATVKLGYHYSQEYTTDKVRVLALATNRGKGGAVRLVSARKLFITSTIFPPAFFPPN